jgi:hypothetical protein
MLKVGTIVKFKVPDGNYNWYTNWYGDMVRAGECGKIIEHEGSRYRVKPLSEDTKSHFGNFTTDANTVEAVSVYKKF